MDAPSSEERRQVKNSRENQGRRRGLGVAYTTFIKNWPDHVKIPPKGRFSKCNT